MEGLAGEAQPLVLWPGLGALWKAGWRPGLRPHPCVWGGEDWPGLRLPARADKGPSGAPTNGLSLVWGV